MSLIAGSPLWRTTLYYARVQNRLAKTTNPLPDYPVPLPGFLLLPVGLSRPLHNQHYFYNCLFLWNKTCLKGTVARDFLPPIFLFMNTPDSMAKNMPKIAEVKLSSCGFKVAYLKKNCDCRIAELRLRSNISLKVAELRLRKCFLQVAELRLRTQKKVARAHLWV